MRSIPIRRWAKRLLSAVTYIFDSALLLVVAVRRPRRSEKLVLMVRLDNIGDFILWLPSALRLSEAWRLRGFRTVGVVGTNVAGLAKDIALFDDVWPIDRNKFRLNILYRTRQLWRIFRYGAAEAVHPVWSRELSLGDAIIRFSGASRRIGWLGSYDNITRLGKRIGDRSYTELLADPPGSVGEVGRNEAFLDGLGLPVEPLDRKLLPARPVMGASLPERYFVLVPGANFGGRRWPSTRFADVARQFQTNSGLVGVICGGVGDRRLARVIIERSGVPLIDLTGRTSLMELVDVLARATLIISNDTAAIHIAALVGTPSVCIVGGGLPGRFVPYGPSRLVRYTPPRVVQHPMPCFHCNWNCHFEPAEAGSTPCVAAVTVEQVLAQALDLADALPHQSIVITP